MNYKVLYRKYRPINFTDIIGQDYITNILKQSIKNGKISHAYLFCGPRGTGKTSTARVFAKAINCQNSSDFPCNNCCACNLFEESSDIIEIDAASNNGVDEIRELKNNVKLASADFKYKVYIIDEVHMLSPGAFNALLKTLEEPPGHVVFILATTEPQKLPITVVSRCQRFDFHKISTHILAKFLKNICDKEKMEIETEVLNEIAIIADGAVRDALGILENLKDINEKITISKFTEMLSTISISELDSLFNAMENNNIKEIDQKINKIDANGIEFTTFINKFIGYLKEKALLIKSEKLKCNLAFVAIKNLIFQLNKILFENRTAVSPYILTEMAILDVLPNFDSEKLNFEEKTNQKINFLEKKEIKFSGNNLPDIEKKITADVKAEMADLNNIKKIKVNNCFVGATKEYLEKNKKIWQEFIEKVENEYPKLLQYVLDSNCVVASSQYLVVVVKAESQSIIFNKNAKKIEKLFFEIYQIKTELISLDIEEWNRERKEYIANKKEGKEYKYIELKIKNKTKKSEVKKAALNIFDKKIVRFK